MPLLPFVHLSQLTKRFLEGDRERRLFSDLELTVGRGEALALVGRSGSGKSTLLNLIGGIDLPTSGRVEVDGLEISALDDRQRTLFRRTRVGLIYQIFNLIPTLTVGENLLLPLELNGQSGKAAQGRALAMLAEVALADRADNYPERLSGGEQQRVAIARALVHEPALVLADEPTGNLDGETARRVLALLERLVKVRGSTLILVTHSPEAAAIADRTVTLADGRLTEASG